MAFRAESSYLLEHNHREGSSRGSVQAAHRHLPHLLQMMDECLSPAPCSSCPPSFSGGVLAGWDEMMLPPVVLPTPPPPPTTGAGRDVCRRLLRLWMGRRVDGLPGLIPMVVDLSGSTGRGRGLSTYSFTLRGPHLT